MDVEELKEWVTALEASKGFGVNVKTIRVWRERGLVRAIQGKTGRWRYNLQDLINFWEEKEAGK